MELMAGRLDEARRRRFVGRAEETGLLRSVLAGEGPDLSVLHVHGPGGVGKTALLRALGQIAAEAGVTAVRVDGRAVDPSPQAFADVPGGERVVLLIDTYESLRPLDGWIREELIPGLRADSVVVIAGREPPSAGWSADPAWRDLLRVIRLGNLSPRDVRAYARAEGLGEEQSERLIAATHGHPLALTLLAGLLRDDPEADLDLAGAPDVVGRLVECFVAGLPGERHRLALQVAAHARFTTEPLLRAAMETEDVREVFAWLRGLPFMDPGPLGVHPHDLVREVVCADLRWRDPPAFAGLHHRIRDHLIGRIRATEGREQHRWVIDTSFLIRANPAVSGYWDWTRLGEQYAEPASARDHAEILAMTERHEGEESAALAAYWLDHPAAQASVVRGEASEGVLGFGLVLRLDRLSEQDLAVDPGPAAAWAHVRANGPLAPGEEVTMSRFFMDRDHYQGPSASRNVAMARHTQRLLTSPEMAFDFLCSFTGDGAATAPIMTHIGYDRLPEADCRVGATRYAAFVRDWRGRTPQAWLDMMGDRDIGLVAPAPHTPPPSREQFAGWVRLALRHLHTPDRLAVSPLLRCKIAGGADPAVLQEALHEAVREVGDDPRTHRLFLVLDRTYLRPAQTQEKAAEALGLALSTYRRHLTRGLDRVVELLWTRELNTTRNGT